MSSKKWESVQYYPLLGIFFPIKISCQHLFVDLFLIKKSLNPCLSTFKGDFF